MYAVGVSRETNDNTGEGRNALYYSVDGGENWQQIGRYFLDASDIFFGSDYIFVAGGSGLWRYPRPVFSAPSAERAPTTSISIDACYPNPATDDLHLRLSVARHAEVTIRWFDMNGRVVPMQSQYNVEAGTAEIAWDTKHIPSGTYVIDVSALGQHVSKRVVIMK